MSEESQFIWEVPKIDTTVLFDSGFVISEDPGQTSGLTIANSVLGVNSSMDVNKEQKLPVKFAFGLMKKKLTTLQYNRIKARLKKLEALFNETSESGQIALSERAFTAMEVLLKETELYGFGYKHFLTDQLLDEFIKRTADQQQRRNAHIYATPFSEYTRIIPDDVLKKYKKAEACGVFDSFVIVHHDPTLSNVSEKEKKKIKREKDPILFGRINNCNRLYFIADWVDEYCDLTFDDILDKLSLDDDDITLTKDPTVNVPDIAKR